jgi:nitroimidazol reductase NimA-like FMN-containing flavoprotein (pyridoxamine 5'-phosphate oxidase superfamily)
MGNSMRRKEKEIKDPEVIQKIFKEADICRIALSDGEKPYLVPMNFAYHNNTLYLHSATEGRKIDILSKNNQVCFQLDIKTELVTSGIPCNWGMKYLSVVGFGKAHIIDKPVEKREGLDIIMHKYSSEESFSYIDEAISKVIVIRVEIDEATGKKSGY